MRRLLRVLREAYFYLATDARGPVLIIGNRAEAWRNWQIDRHLAEVSRRVEAIRAEDGQ